MIDLFLKFINMSISASWLIIVVIILRLLLKKAPKWLNPILWVIVGLRLIMPFSIESALSLIPSTETISPEIIYVQEPKINSGIPMLNNVVNPILTETFAPETTSNSVNPLQIWTYVATIVWIVGIVFMIGYFFISYLRLKKRVNTAVLFRDNIYQSENVSSPFILGFICPRIYLPFGMTDKNMEYVIAHEQTHIRRRDHWVKPIGFLLLSLYWFNPFLWLAYILLCRDIEFACDERVIKRLEAEERADYLEVLLDCSIPRKRIAACPLAFGEVGVKKRVKNVLNYKKPAFWIIIIAVLACIFAAVCFLTNPDGKENSISNKVTDNSKPIFGESKKIIEEHMAALKVEDVKSIDGMGSGEKEKIVQAINRGADNLLDRTQDMQISLSEDVFRCWDMYVYLTKDNASRERKEYFNLSISWEEENIVQIYYCEGSAEFGKYYFEDAELYNIILSQYRREGEIDNVAFEKYKDILNSRAEEHIRDRKITSNILYTDYDITEFVNIRSFEEKGARYELYKWDVAYSIDEPLKGPWAGHVWLDSECRMRDDEPYNHFIVRIVDEQIQDYRFLFDPMCWPTFPDMQGEVFQKNIVDVFTSSKGNKNKEIDNF